MRLFHYLTYLYIVLGLSRSMKTKRKFSNFEAEALSQTVHKATKSLHFVKSVEEVMMVCAAIFHFVICLSALCNEERIYYCSFLCALCILTNFISFSPPKCIVACDIMYEKQKNGQKCMKSGENQNLFEFLENFQFDFYFSTTRTHNTHK